MVRLSSTRNSTSDKVKKLTEVKYSKWDKAYRKDKLFRLYNLDYDGWRYTYYGDDLANVTAELTVRWPHIIDEAEEEYHWQRRFCKLAAYLEREKLL